MKSVFSLVLLAAAALAQNAVIGLPKQGQSVTPGTNITVQIQRPNSLTGSEEVALVIGFQSCPSGPCIAPTSYMGQILYNGPFSPVYHETYNPPYQNFSVQIPASAPSGMALIGVAHVTLVGAGSYPYMEVLNQTVSVA
ncbi:hypothetical protein PAXRUDRAFT_162890 [Paxillus rubicundulus Ve08.2h10]|uniref:Phosphatidylglycerol/phosphatidylinositol transfer protein n=1 Tax=Paxillus rubicundulus Ve08.2h10 TaxID=930991 RepID=A0A0D0CTV1_9AGAM|nr:hypothetical protein PAXRUDRAFT_162890 [Paxillus rubicundulus Ve08.2h10]